VQLVAADRLDAASEEHVTVAGLDGVRRHTDRHE
jgi:hypothetical protein